MTDHNGLSDAAPGRWRGMALFIALVVAFAAAFAWTSWKSVRERELTAMSALAELGKNSIETYFAQIESALRVLGGEVRGAGGEVDLKRAGIALKRFKQAYPDLQIVIVTRPDGQIAASSDAASGVTLPTLAGEPSFVLGRDELMQGATLSMGRAFLGPISKQWIIPLRYGVRDGGGKLLFLVGAGLPLAKPQSLWKDAPLPANAALGLLRDDGFLISRYPVPAEVELADVYGTQREGPVLGSLKEHGFPASGTVDGRSKVSGENTMFAFRRLSRYPLTFFVANPVANIRAAWWQQVQISCMLLAVLGVGGVATYRWSNRQQAAWERERERRVRELESANRELEAFSYSVSHDLRAPLRSIMGFGNFLLEENYAQLDNDGRSRLQRILAAARRMGGLIDELLNFSRISRAVISCGTVDVSALARECIAALADASPERRVAVVIAPGLAAYADRALIQIALDNLLANAWKFTGKAGEARIEVGETTAPGGEPAFYVRDNGAGFDMAYAGKLFTPFQRMHSTQDFEGTGIGLATVKRIIERHHGRIWLESAVNAGTTIYFTLGDPA